MTMTKISLFMNYLLFKINNYVIFIIAKIKIDRSETN